MIKKPEPRAPFVINDLRNYKAAVELLGSKDLTANTEWIENNFLMTSWGRIDWSKVPGSFCTQPKKDSELKEIFEEIIEEKNLGGTLIVSWSDPSILPIKINIDALKKYVVDIFYEESDTLICSEQDEWCIEHYRYNEICFGKCIKS